MSKTILFSVSSLGLGHATRTLPIIRAYLPTHRVHIICTGDALHLLKSELQGERVVFHEYKDYPPLERGTGWRFYGYLVVDIFLTMLVIHREHAFVEALAEQIEPACVIADGRYGSYLKHVPSFLISHQISFVMPRGLRVFQGIADHLNFVAFKKFGALFIPDYENVEHNLAGVLSHHPMLGRLRHRYVGILSSLSLRETQKDVDVLFSTGGFLSEHKPTLVAELVEQARQLPGKKVFILGEVRGEHRQVLAPGDIEIYSLVQGQERQELFNRAKFVVARGGYTTIMDLVELGKPGLLIPTPGQTEQEYLATLHEQRKHFFASGADTIDVGWANARKDEITLFRPPWRTSVSVEKIRTIVAEATRPHFFSIIIPAHNEERYLEATLEHVKALGYPQDSFEVLVVENGSSDRTHEIARRYHGDNVSVHVSGGGVSRAKNFGLEKISKKSDWVIFLDADTHLEHAFLHDLDRYLRQYKHRNFVIGTTTVKPLGNKSSKARAWFRLYNFGHKVSKTSFAIQIMRSPLKEHVRFDEHIHFAEDLKLIKELLDFGTFFYFDTATVGTSTRRFDAVGWWKQFFKWNWEALILSKTKKKMKDYRVIR